MNHQKTAAISGTTGLIGGELRKHFEQSGWKVILLGRKDFALSDEALAQNISDVDAVLHFAGAPIIKRWTKKYKQEIYDSRILTTRKLVNAIEISTKKPRVMIAAAAVGIYNQECVQDEYSNQFDDGFIGKLCLDWEAEADRAKALTRLAIVRLGIVLTKKGGALKTMLLPFRMGLGGKIADGNQPFAWIHLSDVVKAVDFLVHTEKTNGVYNLVAPELINNRQFTVALAKVLNRPAILPVPAFALMLLYGEAALTLTSGQKVVPMRLVKDGFEFGFPEIKGALGNLLGD